MRGCATPRKDFAKKPRGCAMMPKPKKRHHRRPFPIGMALLAMRRMAKMAR